MLFEPLDDNAAERCSTRMYKNEATSVKELRIFEDDDVHLSMELCSGGCLTDRVKSVLRQKVEVALGKVPRRPRCRLGRV